MRALTVEPSNLKRTVVIDGGISDTVPVQSLSSSKNKPCSPINTDNPERGFTVRHNDPLTHAEFPRIVGCSKRAAPRCPLNHSCTHSRYQPRYSMVFLCCPAATEMLRDAGPTEFFGRNFRVVCGYLRKAMRHNRRPPFSHRLHTIFGSSGVVNDSHFEVHERKPSETEHRVFPSNR